VQEVKEKRVGIGIVEVTLAELDQKIMIYFSCRLPADAKKGESLSLGVEAKSVYEFLRKNLREKKREPYIA